MQQQERVSQVTLPYSTVRLYAVGHLYGDKTSTVTTETMQQQERVSQVTLPYSTVRLYAVGHLYGDKT